MAGIGEAASIIQIIGTAEQVLTLCIKYYTSVKNARKDAQRLQNEVIALRDTLESLQEIVDGGANTSLLGVQKLRLNGFLTFCHCELQVLSEKLEKGQSFDKFGKRLLKWPFTSKEIESLVQLFERYKSSINLTLGVDQSDQLSKLTSNILSISKDVEDLKVATTNHNDTICNVGLEVSSMSQNFTSANSYQILQNIVRWLSTVDPSLNHAAAFSSCDASTGSWFHEHPAFASWKIMPNSFLSLLGIPGSGKTVLCSVVVERLIEEYASDHSFSYAYFYFDFRDREKQNASNFVSSLCGQLCRWVDPLPNEVVSLYEICHQGMQKPVLARLMALLKTLLLKLQEVFIVIDAIDECPRGPRREKLLETLVNIKQFALPNLHILVSSRAEPDIEFQLRYLSTAPIISMTNASVNSDIADFISHAIKSEPKLSRWPQHIRSKIQIELLQQSQGMFRWVACQLDALKRCVSTRAVEEALASLPKSLDETYERILQSVPEEYQKKLQIGLVWLTCSRRPMTVEEIAEVMVCEPDSGDLLEENSRLNNPLDVLDILGSLVTVMYPNFTGSEQSWSYYTDGENIVESAEEESSEDEDKNNNSSITLKNNMKLYADKKWARFYTKSVRFGQPKNSSMAETPDIPEYMRSNLRIVALSHASVRDFLLSKRTKHGSVGSFSVDTTLANSYILRTCLAYLLALSQKQLLTGDDVLTESFPLKWYASRYWYDHGPDTNNNPDVKVATLKFLVKDTAVFDWIMHTGSTMPLYAAELSRLYAEYRWRPDYFTTDSGIQVIVQTLAGQRPRDFHGESWLRQWPQAFSTIEPAGKHAIDNIADLNISRGDGKIMLYAAAASDNQALVNALLDLGCDPNGAFEPDATELHAAAERGYVGIVMSILKHQVDLNARNSKSETPLFISAKNNHEQVVTILIQKGANLDARAYVEWTPLYAAANNGHLKIVQHLLKAGADMNLKTETGGTALSAAAWQGHQDIVQCLLEHQGILESEAGQQTRTLHSVVSRGNISLLKVLLDGGADIEAINVDGDSLLQTAVHHSQVAVVKLLLDRGANVSSKNNRGESALFSTVRANDTKVMGLLLAHGADIESTNDYNETPLELAADQGSGQMVHYLIDHGAQSTNLNLIPFTRNGDINMVHMLLRRGANRQRVGYNYGRIALHWAADYGMIELVKLLALDQSDLDFMDAEGKTAVFYAAIHGHGNVVAYLQQQGAKLMGNVVAKQELIDMRNWRPV